MPELTLILTDEEWGRLGQRADELKLPDRDDVALYCLRRELWKAPRNQGTEEYRSRQSLRLKRQVALIDHVRARGFPTTREDRSRLAEQLGVSERTLYRDLDLAAQSMADVKGPGVVVPYAGRAAGGRPPRVPRPGATGTDGA